MKKQKLLSKTLSVAAFGLAISSACASVSCSSIDNLFITFNGGNGLEVTLCDKGASIYSIKYKGEYMTYHPHDKKTFLRDDFYYGKALGRVAGRFKDGNLEMPWGDKYQLEVNEVNHNLPIDKNNCLHGGKHSFTAKTFERSVIKLADKYIVGYHTVSPNGEGNFPGEVEAWYAYTIYRNESKIDLDIYATASELTTVNLSNHPYFRLGNGGDIKQHKLTIPAERMGWYDNMEDTVTHRGGQIVLRDEPVNSHYPWNFNTSKPIGQDIAAAASTDPVSGGYDHIWCLDQSENVNNTITLYNPSNNINLDVTTDATGVIMYANCYPHEGMPMNDGTETDTQYAAITIEPYTFFTKSDITPMIIDSDHPFTRHISYVFSKN